MKGRTRTFLVYLLTAVFSFFLGLFLLDQVILPHLSGGQEQVTVPLVEGMSSNQAREACLGAGLGFEVQGETYHAVEPANHVMKQDPEPGSLVKQGRQVYALISLGPEMVSVPHVQNLTQRQAEILIERSMLKVSEVKTVSDPSIPRGRVLDISPPAGESLPGGSTVVLTVSEGVEQVRVPSVIDKPLEEAEKILQGVGLKLGGVTRKYNRFITVGHVMDQMPLERAVVNVGTSVAVVVSGSEP